MACFESGTIVDLAARESLVLTDVQGVTLRVNRGTLWITQHNDSQDVVLRPGDTWMVERDGNTIIEAQSSATVCASGKNLARALKSAVGPTFASPARPGSWRTWTRACIAAWWSLTPQRHIPHV